MEKIEIVRGTTNTFRISITDAAGKPYIPVAGDRVVFGVKKNRADETLLITKTAQVSQDGRAQVKIEPEDTAELCCDNYYYDISLETGEDFYNIVEASPFRISYNITSKGCV